MIERSAPVSVEELGRILSERHARIVLAFTNVIELVPHTESQEPDRRRALRIIGQVERLPYICIRSSEISRFETRSAIHAFETARAVVSIDPYRDQWWETFWWPPSEYLPYLEPEKYADLRTLTLVQQIDYLLHYPACLRFDKRDQERIKASVEDDRKRLGTLRGSPKSFAAGLKSLFVRFGWPEPAGGIDAFVQFVAKTPEACPGWRMSHDTYEEFRCNLTAAPKKNDIPDFSHIAILPYVTHATLDRAWRTRCEQARDRRRKEGVVLDAYDRVHANLETILKSGASGNRVDSTH